MNQQNFIRVSIEKELWVFPGIFLVLSVFKKLLGHPVNYHLFFSSRKSPKTPDRAGKKPRVWEFNGNNKDLPNLDRSKDKPGDMASNFTPNDDMVS